jgi:hypothetical protein
MYSINDEQIDYILNDIRRRGVEMEDLQYNLLDHICCIVEQNLESGGNFEDFYNKTIPKFFKHELWEIEEETILLLTYKNYYTMKKAMIYGGVFSLATIAMGTVFKIFHWPGASPLLLLGFLVLSFVFFPSALYLNYSAAKKSLGTNLLAFLGGVTLIIGVLFKVMHWPLSHLILIWGWGILLGLLVPALLFSKLREGLQAKEKMIYTIGAIGLILFGSAILFKIMHWAGAGPLLILGSFLLIVLFVPMYTNMQIKANKMTPGQFIFVITLSMYAVVLTSLLAMNVSKHVIERFVSDAEDNTQIVNYFQKKRARLMSEIKNDTIQSAQTENQKLVIESAAKVKEVISSMRLDLIQVIEGVDKTAAQELVRNPGHLIRMDNYDLVNSTILPLVPGDNCKATELKKVLDEYRSVASKAAANNEKLTTMIQGLLNTDPGSIEGIKVNWEETTFRNNILISTLCRLSDIEKNVSLIETEILNKKN